MVAAGVTVGGIFLLTLLIVSVITVRISDMILDSRVGALDRTLGFLFGLGRGLIIVVVAFLFFAWLVPDRSQPNGCATPNREWSFKARDNGLSPCCRTTLKRPSCRSLKKRKPEDQEPSDSWARPALGICSRQPERDSDAAA